MRFLAQWAWLSFWIYAPVLIRKYGLRPVSFRHIKSNH